MNIKWKTARTSWDPHTPAGNHKNGLNPVPLALVAEISCRNQDPSSWSRAHVPGPEVAGAEGGSWERQGRCRPATASCFPEAGQDLAWLQRC